MYLLKLYRNQKSAFMTTTIFNAIICDLSEYLNLTFPGEVFAVMCDNASCHKLIVELPHNNIRMLYLPPLTTGYLQVNNVSSCPVTLYYQWRRYIMNIVDHKLFIMELFLFQACDMLFNGVLKLKYKLLMEDYILERHFNNEKLTVNEEQGSRMATQAYNDISKSIVEDWVRLYKRFTVYLVIPINSLILSV